ncbi:MAG: SusD/RagB family nutrient-binding outer membrane lipoprotein [Rickettsiales bacterium]|nr:SusD/RagB family nutrient-binding outer membrane lipoprotein [Rickettsiales bacterium]
MMKTIKIFGLASFILLNSCDFGDTNIDPSKLDDVEVSQILPAAEAQTARNMGSVGARVSGVVIQHFKGIADQPLAYNTYLIDENALDDYWVGGLYAGAMKDCQIIIEKGESQDIPHYVGIAKILMSINLGIATSFWGDIPYSEALKGFDQLKPTYDSQEAIYETIQTLLDEAIEDLNQEGGEFTPGKDDLIYEGNRALWLGTARALKARYYMHLVKRNPNASVNALTVLGAGTIYANTVQPEFPFGPIQNEANPIAYYGEDRAGQIAMNPFLLDLLDTKDDPRKQFYTRVVNGNNVIYVRNDKEDAVTDLYWGQFDSPMPLISYSELLFIRAEANLRAGIATLAQSNLNNAVRANMEVLGVDEADIQSYITSHLDLASLTDEQKLAKIMEEKFVAMFGQGAIECWVDYRRTGYPELDPATDASESFNPSKVIPQRYLYPISERSTNRENMEEAVSRQGGHLLDQTLWAFQ